MSKIVTLFKRHVLFLFAILLAGSSFPRPLQATEDTCVLLECEQFDRLGGWVVDQQFMDQMGSPYLLAHGLGEPVADANTTVKFPKAAEYRVWVRTRDWVAPWKASGAPGKFQLFVDSKPLAAIFGTEGAGWHWQDGGIVKVGREAVIRLHDLTGFEGRCDAILFCSDSKFQPPNDLATLTKFRRTTLGLPENPEDGGRYDLVVVGGGIAGTCAAVSAARMGLTVALVQDRPVLGGNGSSEVRVWPEGNIRQEPYRHIGDVVAELLIANTMGGSRNAKSAEIYSDERKLSVVRAEPNISLFTEQHVNGVEASGGTIRSVTAQHIRTNRRLRFTGRWFADCTGDGTVGFLGGANFEVTSEDHMGVSNLWNLRTEESAKDALKCECKDNSAIGNKVVLTSTAAPFPRCLWAVDLTDKPFPGRVTGKAAGSTKNLSSLGDWFWESGFKQDPIADVEWMRDQNWRAMYGAWDALKNVDKLYPNHKLNWAAFIAGKRESRRLLGDVILTGDDFRAGRFWEDGCFPCSWSIDLHLPNPKFQKSHEGQEFISKATVGGKGYTYKTPYWAPYRCLFSRNIGNLFMAGRDISVTHDALGAVRVMRTCGMMGEIVGLAASLCNQYKTTPRGIYEKHLEDLKRLMTKGAGKVASSGATSAPIVRSEVAGMKEAAGETRSPSGITNARIEVAPDGRLTYSVKFHSNLVITASPLGITVDKSDLGANVEVKGCRRESGSETYPLLGAHSQATNSYRGAIFQILQKESARAFTLETRCFDEGFAWRYRVPSTGTHRVQGEASSWTLPDGSTIWFGERNNPWKLKSYAGEWMAADIAEMPGISRQGPVQGPPLVAELPVGGYAALTEAACFNYSGMRLKAVGGGRFQANFSEQAGFDLDGEIVTPWRVIILASDLDGLVNQTVVQNLAPPPDPELFRDPSWLRPPGWAVWRWQLQGAGQLDDQKGFVRDAAKLGFPYTMVDDGWEKYWKDPMGDLKQLCKYAGSKQVGVFVWKPWAELRQPDDNYAELRKWLDAVKEAGVTGIKVDFFNSENLETRRGENAVLRESAKRHLMVDLHGCPKPTGEERTYPNELTREAVRGLELNFMPEGPLPPRHNAALPFTRYIIGPGDYTPVTFQPGYMGKTTAAHQLATAVVTTSPLQVLNEIPGNILNHPVKEVPEIIKTLPTVWDETRVLPDSKIGELAIMARRRGDLWFLGVVNGDSPRSLRVPLRFLSKQKYEALVIQDGQESPLAMIAKREPVTPESCLNFRLPIGGGAVARFMKIYSD